MLAVARREWVGIWGPEGWVGYRNEGYWITLNGKGPVFTNPDFYDDPPEYHCIGEVTLDLEHKRVTLAMRRVVSKPGQAVRTRRHPANGTYEIESVKKVLRLPGS